VHRDGLSEQADAERPGGEHSSPGLAPNWAWGTVVSYGSSCGNCQRINYWSNPYKTDSDGQVMGTSASEDNARVLGNTEYTIRDFRTLIHPGNVAHITLGIANVVPALSWSPVMRAKSYQVWGCVITTGSGYSDSCFYSVGWRDRNHVTELLPVALADGQPEPVVQLLAHRHVPVRTSSPEGLLGCFPQINICVC
jgi:hypothetical protein